MSLKTIQGNTKLLLLYFSPTPGPKSLEDYFQKGALLGQKAKYLVRQFQAKFAKTGPELLKFCHIWLIKFLKNYV